MNIAYKAGHYLTYRLSSRTLSRAYIIDILELENGINFLENAQGISEFITVFSQFFAKFFRAHT